MNVDQLNPSPINKVSFSLASLKLLPKSAGCYVLSTYDNVILYIGLATTLNSRFSQHLDNTQKTNPTEDGKAVWFHYLHYDASNLPMLERTWLNQYMNIHGRLPILNKVSSPVK